MSKITDYPAKATPAASDVLLLVDAADHTQSSLGSTKQTTVSGIGTALNPMSALGDLIIGGTAGVQSRLAAGSRGQVLGIGAGGTPAWGPVPVDWVNVQTQYGAYGDNSHDDTMVIQNAISSARPGQVVYFPPGVYRISAPLVPLAGGGTVLRGAGGAAQGAGGTASDFGSVIKPLPGFTSSLPVTAVIALLHGTGTDNTVIPLAADIRDLWIDGSSGPASGVDGIAAWGAMYTVSIRNVGIYEVSGNGVAGYKNTNFTSSNGPQGWNMETVIIQQCGVNGLLYSGTDGSFANVHAQKCGTTGTGDGLYITGQHNQFTGCRGDLCVNGITVDSSSGYPSIIDSNTFTGGGTQRNQKNGLNVINSSAAGTSARSPLLVTGATFDGDGVNSGAGGGGYAGIAVAGSNTVVLSACNVLVATEDAASGCPAYGLATASSGTGPGVPDVVQMNGGFLNGVVAMTNDAAPSYSFRVSPSTAGYGGGQYQNPASTPPHPVQLPAFLGSLNENFLHPVSNPVAATVPRSQVTAVQGAMASGTVYLMAIGLNAGTPVGHCMMMTGTTAKLGGTHGWYVLCDKNLSVLAVTADQTDPATQWGAASTPYPLAFTSQYIATYSGLYYVGVMVAATTMPTFLGPPSLAFGVASQSPSYAGTSSTGQGAPPTPGSSVLATISPSGSILLYAVLS